MSANLVLNSGQYGVLSNEDSLLVQLQENTNLIPQFGERDFARIVLAYLQAHNQNMREKLDLLVEQTQERTLGYGTTQQMEMEAIDETGRVDVQQIKPVPTIAGFPLRTFAIGLQWTRRYLENSTVGFLATQVVAATSADAKNVDRQIKRAFFAPINYTFVDREVDDMALPVKALYNADGTIIPDSPDGRTFDGATHTHYLTSATLTEASVTSLLNTVTEHYAGGTPIIFINQGSEAGFRAFSSAVFQPYVVANVQQSSTSVFATGRNLDLRSVYNRPIGLYNGAEVWTKPWIPAGYVVCVMLAVPKVLAMRTRSNRGTFQLANEAEDYPLRAQQFERQFGLAVWRRSAAAILQITAGAYAQPLF